MKTRFVLRLYRLKRELSSLIAATVVFVGLGIIRAVVFFVILIAGVFAFKFIKLAITKAIKQRIVRTTIKEYCNSLNIQIDKWTDSGVAIKDLPDNNAGWFSITGLYADEVNQGYVVKNPECGLRSDYNDSFTIAVVRHGGNLCAITTEPLENQQNLSPELRIIKLGTVQLARQQLSSNQR